MKFTPNEDGKKILVFTENFEGGLTYSVSTRGTYSSSWILAVTAIYLQRIKKIEEEKSSRTNISHYSKNSPDLIS